MQRYSKYFEFRNEVQANQIAEMARKRDGAVLEVVGNCIYFPDKFTFDHIVYHYKVKMVRGEMTVKTIEG